MDKNVPAQNENRDSLVNITLQLALRSNAIQALDFDALLLKIAEMDSLRLLQVIQRISKQGDLLSNKQRPTEKETRLLSIKVDRLLQDKERIDTTDIEILKEFTTLLPYQLHRLQMRPDLQYDMLKDKIIGQDDALKKLLLYTYSIDRYWTHVEADKLVQKPRTTQLLIGESGSGKSYIISEICKLLDAHIIKIDGASLVAEGFVGHNIAEQIFYELNGIPEEKRTRVLIHIDEFDKLSTIYNKHGSEAKGVGVCNELLKYLDYKTEKVRGVATVDGKKNVPVELDVKHFCYVLSGAFTGLHKNEQTSQHIGFKPNDNTTDIQIADILNYGIPKELIGRIGSINCLNSVTKEMIIEILNADFPPIKDLEQKFQELGQTLEVSKDFDTIAELTIAKQIGVRGLAPSIEELYSGRLAQLLGL